MAVEAKSAEDLAAERKGEAEKVAGEKVKRTNEARTGKGPRLTFGWTRGKNSQLFYYEQYDRTVKDSCPTTIEEVMSLISDSEPILVGYILDGWNAESYSNSSDPANEFVDDSWPEDVQKQFKIALKNFSTASNLSLEAAAAVLKPAITAGLAKKA